MNDNNKAKFAAILAAQQAAAQKATHRPASQPAAPKQATPPPAPVPAPPPPVPTPVPVPQPPVKQTPAPEVQQPAAAEVKRPELSTVTFADLMGTSKPIVKAAPAPVYCAPARFNLVKATAPEVAAAVMPAAPEAPAAPALLLVAYSPKSFAIFGPGTFDNRYKLATLGGSFNRWLKHEGKTCEGWIFSNRHLAAVKKAFNL